eukprot:TRINITY_DN597_c1_g4_i1.p1 TRINITY_DN597_c1_g4~~TRINITY_DN597_c1_g4_i1.p1  ORF type:complete len:551 (-),score=275.61 TRINITY_DN597_c1_g4_i1:267-1832(-)
MAVSKHVEAETAGKKKQKKAVAAAAEEEVAEVDPAAAKKQKKAAKRAAAEAAAAEEAEVDPAEAKRQRKAAKKAAAEAAAAAEAEEEDPAEAKKKKKAAKKAAAAEAAAAEEEAAEEDPAEAKKKRKAAKKAAAEAAAAAAAEAEEEEEEAPKKKKSKKEAAKEEEEEAPKAKKTEEKEDDGCLEVFVGGLPWETTEEVLRKDFAECGEITNFKMPMNDEGKAKGIAFIEFADAAGVTKALAFDGTEYGGRWLKVKKSSDPPSKDGGKSKGKGKDGKGKDGGKGAKEFEIFVGGLPFETTEDVLKKDFAECGEIVNFRLPLNDEGKSRGIAFIEYTNQDSVDKALKFHETEYGGRWISVRKAGDRGDKGKGKGKDGKDGKGKDGKSKGKGNSEFEVFVGGVPDSATEDSLKETFGKCGDIERLRLPLNEEGNPKGICFIQFKDKDACDKAVNMTDTEMDGSYLRVKMSGDGKGKGKDGKGKGKGKGKKSKDGLSSEKTAAKHGSMGVPEGKKQTFDDSDDE